MFSTDDGSITVETAVALSSLMVVFLAMIAGLSIMAAHLSAVDSAGAAARAYTIGIDYTPPRGEVTITEHNGLATATATVPSITGSATATAIFPVEHP